MEVEAAVVAWVAEVAATKEAVNLTTIPLPVSAQGKKKKYFKPCPDNSEIMCPILILSWSKLIRILDYFS